MKEDSASFGVDLEPIKKVLGLSDILSRVSKLPTNDRHIFSARFLEIRYLQGDLKVLKNMPSCLMQQQLIEEIEFYLSSATLLSVLLMSEKDKSNDLVAEIEQLCLEKDRLSDQVTGLMFELSAMSDKYHLVVQKLDTVLYGPVDEEEEIILKSQQPKRSWFGRTA